MYAFGLQNNTTASTSSQESGDPYSVIVEKDGKFYVIAGGSAYEFSSRKEAEDFVDVVTLGSGKPPSHWDAGTVARAIGKFTPDRTSFFSYVHNPDGSLKTVNGTHVLVIGSTITGTIENLDETEYLGEGIPPIPDAVLPLLSSPFNPNLKGIAMAIQLASLSGAGNSMYAAILASDPTPVDWSSLDPDTQTALIAKFGPGIKDNVTQGHVNAVNASVDWTSLDPDTQKLLIAVFGPGIEGNVDEGHLNVLKALGLVQGKVADGVSEWVPTALGMSVVGAHADLPADTPKFPPVAGLAGLGTKLANNSLIVQAFFNEDGSLKDGVTVDEVVTEIQRGMGAFPPGRDYGMPAGFTVPDESRPLFDLVFGTDVVVDGRHIALLVSAGLITYDPATNTITLTDKGRALLTANNASPPAVEDPPAGEPGSPGPDQAAADDWNDPNYVVTDPFNWEGEDNADLYWSSIGNQDGKLDALTLSLFGKKWSDMSSDEKKKALSILIKHGFVNFEPPTGGIYQDPDTFVKSFVHSGEIGVNEWWKY